MIALMLLENKKITKNKAIVSEMHTLFILFGLIWLVYYASWWGLQLWILDVVVSIVIAKLKFLRIWTLRYTKYDYFLLFIWAAASILSLIQII